ncbi:MAG: hypothetical protein QM651_03285 [Rhodoblastus sp.]
MEAAKAASAHLYAIAVRGALAYEGELRDPNKDGTPGATILSGVRLLTVADHTNPRDTLVSLLAALDAYAAEAAGTVAELILYTNNKGYAQTWALNHSLWASVGSFVRRDNSPLANADLWAKILEHHKRMPIAFRFQGDDTTPEGVRMRVLKLRAKAEATKAANADGGQA